MGIKTKTFLILQTHFDSINKRFINELSYGNMLWVFNSIWVFICNGVLYCFGFAIKYISRLNDWRREPDNEIETNQVLNLAETHGQRFMKLSEDHNSIGNEGEERSALISNKCEHVSSEDIGGFIEEPQSMSFIFHGFNGKRFSGNVSDSDCHKINLKEEGDVLEQGIVAEEEHSVSDPVGLNGEVFHKHESLENRIFSEKLIDSRDCTFFSLKGVAPDSKIEEKSVINNIIQSENCISNEDGLENKGLGELDSSDNSRFDLENGSADIENEEDLFQNQNFGTGHSVSDEIGLESEVFCESDEDYVLFDDYSLASDVESEPSISSDLIWEEDNKIDESFTYEFLVQNDVKAEIMMPESSVATGEEEEEPEAEAEDDEKSRSCHRNMAGITCKRYNSDEEYIELEPHRENSDKVEGKDEEEEVLVQERSEDRHSLEEESKWDGTFSDSNSEEFDYEWEHDDLIEQLKMELRNVRTGGLPTIVEEEGEGGEDEEAAAESPMMVESLKPLKIEEKVEFKDRITEVQKVYKSYAEKMRKLDILNYQTMHAIGFLQLKDPLRFMSKRKSMVQDAKSLVSHNLWPSKAKKYRGDPMLKVVGELKRDLELVYVGQVCLSWEILRWQQGKAQELREYDSEGCHQYNQTVDEFQLFQVLMHRFIENEPFQGPRIENYVKNRCVNRSLLHVPAIRDDSWKNVQRREEEVAISSAGLIETIRDSIRVFRDFVRADKDDRNMTLTDITDPAISELLMYIRTILQKKEKKLKDILRSGNCLVKKLKKRHEDLLSNEQLLAEVELKLVSRVLNMSKLTKDQLIWCHEKLGRIHISGRKIQLEPSFLLFPC